jgi:hypothetical protein
VQISVVCFSALLWWLFITPASAGPKPHES